MRTDRQTRTQTHRTNEGGGRGVGEFDDVSIKNEASAIFLTYIFQKGRYQSAFGVNCKNVLTKIFFRLFCRQREIRNA